MLKFAAMNICLMLNSLALLSGGNFLWLGFMAVLLVSSPVDDVSGDDTAPPQPVREWALLALLYGTLPLLALNWLVFMSYFSAGHPWPVTIFNRLGFDFQASRDDISGIQLAGGFLSLGLYIGAAGTNVAHELIHRADLFSQWVGRCLLAFSFDTGFAIEHVHGHHRHVGTKLDPATARRGDHVYAFAARSFVLGNISAFRIEAERLRKSGRASGHWRNRMLVGQLLSVALLTAAWMIGGASAVLTAVVCGLQGKFYLEIVNYIEHYGLVRVPGKRVESRHSWNCHRKISNALLYNLPRHSHHHSFANKPFWQLEADEAGPCLPYGYMTMIILALMPPFFMSVMEKRLVHWDETQASDDERGIVSRAAA